MMSNSFCSVGFGKWQTKKEFVAFKLKAKFCTNSKLIFLPLLSALQTSISKFVKPRKFKGKIIIILCTQN